MILVTYGTRPEYIKIKPLIEEMKRRGIQFKVMFTGQHKDIAPKDADFNMEMVDFGGNRLDSVVKNCLSVPEEFFEGIKYILVQGDTSSAMGLSLAALHRKIKVIHLEAGLRSFDVDNPYPEENNRKIISTIANIHLCPTEYNYNNLINEGIKDNVIVVGNTVLDNLLQYKGQCSYDNKILITMHRRENHEQMHLWFYAINELAKAYPQYEFILPLHPNPNVQIHKKWLTHVNVVEPMSHEDLINTLIKCRLVITDSGGIQEECSFFNKKALVCRKVTERPESVGLTSFLVEHPSELKQRFLEHIDDYVVNIKCPYGDGKASEYICNALELYVKMG